MSGIHGSGDQLDICGMAQDPRGSNARLAEAVLLSDLGQLFVQQGEIVVVDVGSLEEAELENTDDFVRMKHSKDFDKFSKEVLPTGQIIYKYDNGSVMYSYEFTEL